MNRIMIHATAIIIITLVIIVPLAYAEESIKQLESRKEGTQVKFYQVEGELKPFEAEIGRRIENPSILVTLNGSSETRLTIDSGASGVVVTEDIAKGLNLKHIGKADMVGIGDIGVHKVDAVLINTLEIHGLKIKNVPALIMLNLPFGGVIGLPVIGRFGLVEFDFKKRKLRFTPYDKVSKGKDRAKGETEISFSKASYGYIVIDAMLNDNPCKVEVDTGSSVTFISKSFLERIGVGVRPPMDPRESLGRILGFSGGSANWWIIGQRAKLKIGDKELPVVPARRDRYISGMALAFDHMASGVDIILGMAHLKDFILTVDYLRGLMTLKPSD